MNHSPNSQSLVSDRLEIALQPAAFDIWDQKYRLRSRDSTPVDGTIEDTYQRIAVALAGVEEDEAKRRHWEQRFLWALQHGALPAGRIVANAGAMAHKPARGIISRAEIQ